eukprot:TRINITY_DN15666_c0_g1_i3.p4 TRINITY_DN15666_c0_g1~~TRINITY_DN15666_c0_g1_i3.p4  ORF type:complete len:106 (-),score=3.64 TRINITY_DN15666_c0_g1_i3:43-360(-)
MYIMAFLLIKEVIRLISFLCVYVGMFVCFLVCWFVVLGNNKYELDINVVQQGFFCGYLLVSSVLQQINILVTYEGAILRAMELLRLYVNWEYWYNIMVKSGKSPY